MKRGKPLNRGKGLAAKGWCRQCEGWFHIDGGDRLAGLTCPKGHVLLGSKPPAKPLRAVSDKRAAAGSKRSTLKPGRRRPRQSLVGFHAAVCADGACALHYLGGCSGRLEAHHVVPKQRLKGTEAYTDPRGGVPLCSQHHQQVEWRRVECPRPPYLDEFLADHGLVDPEQQEAA